MEFKFVLMIVFIVVSIVQLVSLYLKYTLLRAVTKSLLMPLLLVFYFFSVEYQNFNWFIALALIFGCAGDIFLINKKPPRFILGLASFLIGHLAYIIAFIGHAMPPNFFLLGISIAILIIYGTLAFKFVNPPKEMRIPVIAYETVISLMVIFAFQVLLNIGGSIGALIFAGSLLFLASDSMLARFTFVKEPKFGPLAVMFTYIAGQFLIVLGFCGL